MDVPAFPRFYSHNNIPSSSALFYLQKKPGWALFQQSPKTLLPAITSDLEFKPVLKEFVAVGPCNSG